MQVAFTHFSKKVEKCCTGAVFCLIPLIYYLAVAASGFVSTSSKCCPMQVSFVFAKVAANCREHFFVCDLGKVMAASCMGQAIIMIVVPMALLFGCIGT